MGRPAHRPERFGHSDGRANQNTGASAAMRIPFFEPQRCFLDLRGKKALCHGHRQQPLDRLGIAAAGGGRLELAVTYCR